MNEITPASIGLSRADLPNSYIGRSVPRPNLPKLVQGRATYTDDVTLPRMVHAAFLRSPFAHARIVKVDKAAAEAVPGVLRVFTGADLAEVC
ncbi:MAG: xanthine dehydrogenase family protein molybdopterin-binding subunit, partial [Rubritepida sp.]|nr:xanthine dehydrogenase family protein molybdopterin-binding subunit [Rubritepida sp.]